MHDIPPIDPGRQIDWSLTSADYAAHRPGPPARLYDMLTALGAGTPGQHVLDLGTGTGLVALEFARRGCKVSGTDIAPGQIDAARQQVRTEGLEADFQVAPAEACPFADASFDIVTASQCWLYFDAERAWAEVQRVLRPGGLLVTTHFSWLARVDPIARASEQLVLKFNPAWKAADWPGHIPSVPAWAEGRAAVQAMFWFDEAVPFTRDSWRGRMRACRGVGATLPPAQVAAFDAELKTQLERTAPPQFTVLHRIDAHLFRPLSQALVGHRLGNESF